MDKNGLELKIRKQLQVSKSDEKALVSSIADFFGKCSRKTAVLGISGGVDSALVCYLAAKALGAKNVFAYHLPYVQNAQDEKDAQQLAKMVGANYNKIDIRRAVDTLTDTFKPLTRIASGNIRVRTRMLALYTFAHEHEALVIGTGNRTEILLGYFTKFGDGAADLLPIGSLYKTQVWGMAQLSGLPKHIIEKVPSAGLWEGQTDERELGVRYSEIDRILACHFDLKMHWEKIGGYFDKVKVARVRELHEKSEHKRRMPGILGN
ncbi:MAG: NAD+ synthase [Candidatus Micrarchaeota archaeon]